MLFRSRPLALAAGRLRRQDPFLIRRGASCTSLGYGIKVNGLGGLRPAWDVLLAAPDAIKMEAEQIWRLAKEMLPLLGSDRVSWLTMCELRLAMGGVPGRTCRSSLNRWLWVDGHLL